MPGPGAQSAAVGLDRGAAGAAAHRRAAIRNGMMLSRRRVLPGTVVMVFVPRSGLRRGRGGLTIIVPWAADLTDSQQLRDQENRGEDAECAMMSHDLV